MADWMKLLASVIVATSGANRAIVGYFNNVSADLCKYAHENYVYRCPAMVEQEKQSARHQCRTGSRTLNIPDKPINIDVATPQPLPMNHSNLYNTFDNLSKRSVPDRSLFTRH